jgi:hypothetical protein
VESELPAIDAVVLSHEHEDHFSIPSFAGIDRRIPVFLSFRSSSAARSILREMGFEVRDLAPGAGVVIGTLQVRVFSPACSARADEDEWDTLAVHVSGQDRQGGFFTNVDVPVTAEMKQEVTSLARREREREMTTIWFDPPRVSLWSPAGGLAESASERRRQRPTSISREQAAAQLAAGRAFNPVPGVSVSVTEDGGIEVETDCRFLDVSLAPAEERTAPSRAFGPCCGERVLSAGALPEVEAGLARLAEWLYGGRLFRRLCALSALSPGRRGTFVLVLLTGGDGEALAYEYDPTRCRFVAMSGEGIDEYMGRVIMWGTDLLGLLRGEFEPRPVTMRALKESWDESLAGVSFARHVLWPFFHPLRHPQACLGQYRRAFEAAASDGVWVRPATALEFGR